MRSTRRHIVVLLASAAIYLKRSLSYRYITPDMPLISRLVLDINQTLDLSTWEELSHEDELFLYLRHSEASIKRGVGVGRRLRRDLKVTGVNS
jgi:hypothetical protein